MKMIKKFVDYYPQGAHFEVVPIDGAPKTSIVCGECGALICKAGKLDCDRFLDEGAPVEVCSHYFSFELKRKQDE